MTTEVPIYTRILVSILPFALFVLLSKAADTKKEIRNRQYIMLPVAALFTIVMLVLQCVLFGKIQDQLEQLLTQLDESYLTALEERLRDLYETWGVYCIIIAFNIVPLVIYIAIKRIVTVAFAAREVKQDSLVGSAISAVYDYDEEKKCWNLKEGFAQARSFAKAIYYGTCGVSGGLLLISYQLCQNKLIRAPFSPALAVIVIGEVAAFLDGLGKEEHKVDLKLQADNAKHIAMYPLLRKPLRELFGDKLSAEGTTINSNSVHGGAVEDILAKLDESGNHVGKNYAAFIRKKMDNGLKPNVDYVRTGYDLAIGKSLLFSTPFYDKLNPYVFYAMNREMLRGGKVLIILGRHGTEEDLQQWCERGMLEVTNIPGMWKISVLSDKKQEEDDLPDIGIVTQSAVHDLDVHKANLPFLKKVSFVFLVEPSRLVTTAQIGLNLLMKCCGDDAQITFCSVDRNCDGLVDALSHILMTNITEVSATEYPHGMSTYMYWTADDDYLQHRILPGVSRYLGVGTELSMVALKNQVKKTIWYGGETFPVLDAHWIAKQYYHDLLDYAKLPTNQEAFDRYFQASFNMSNERVSDYSFITVEDDRNNLFEIRRNFATIAEQQGFVNVISSEYMLREYMSQNTEIFTADAKAIPYITADYARTKRNTVLSLCLLLCIDAVHMDNLQRQMVMLNIDTQDPVAEIWREICTLFGGNESGEQDKQGNPILFVADKDGKTRRFEKNATIQLKRMYSIDSGKFESVYTIENRQFASLILDDLQNATYIAEYEGKDSYIGTELKGHVYQKYLPGQFFTLNGKYYEMVSAAVGNRIVVRRASDHISGRLSYRQVRNYIIHSMEDAQTMGALRLVNNIGIRYQYADFTVATKGYWKMKAYNNFADGDLVEINGVPDRQYHHKQILVFDFSKLGEAFTDEIRMSLTVLLNEAFVTLFADNQPFISAVTPGKFDAPVTYGLEIEGGNATDKCIYIIEDSQLDIGLLVAVERNLNRILQIISDYLMWNSEQIDESRQACGLPPVAKEKSTFKVFDGTEPEGDKRCIFLKAIDWIKGKLGIKSHGPVSNAVSEAETDSVTEETPVASAEGAENGTRDTASEEAVSATAVVSTDNAQQQVETKSVELGKEHALIKMSPADSNPKQSRKAIKQQQREAKKQERAAKKAEKALKKQQKNAGQVSPEATPSQADNERAGELNG